MKAVELDFYRARPASPWAGWLLLAIALAFIADVGLSWIELRRDISTNEARLAQLEGPAAAARAVERRAAAPEELTAARETVTRLTLPWDELFSALEAASTAGIALLSLEPDREGGTVIIRGEARDYASVLSYVEDLRRTKALRDVHLVKHEARDGKGNAAEGAPLAFSISARWKEASR
jgi:Tfp pilus assembly protein PilN